jgi:hypothetical protein
MIPNPKNATRIRSVSSSSSLIKLSSSLIQLLGLDMTVVTGVKRFASN